MESPSITALAWATDGELHPEARATQELMQRIQRYEPIPNLTHEEITRLYKEKSEEIKQYQEWLLSNNLSREDKVSITKCIDDVMDEIIGLYDVSLQTTAPNDSVFEVLDRHREGWSAGK